MPHNMKIKPVAIAPSDRQMENLDPLLTIAEVSVAFAGFASIVTILAKQDVDS